MKVCIFIMNKLSPGEHVLEEKNLTSRTLRKGLWVCRCVKGKLWDERHLEFSVIVAHTSEKEKGAWSKQRKASQISSPLNKTYECPTIGSDINGVICVCKTSKQKKSRRRKVKFGKKTKQSNESLNKHKEKPSKIFLMTISR